MRRQRVSDEAVPAVPELGRDNQDPAVGPALVVCLASGRDEVVAIEGHHTSPVCRCAGELLRIQERSGPALVGAHDIDRKSSACQAW